MSKTIEQQVEEFEQLFPKLMETTETKYGLNIGVLVKDQFTIALQERDRIAREEERERWIKAVGEKIDKPTVEMIRNAFNEGVQMTKESYERSLAAITTPLTDKE